MSLPFVCKKGTAMRRMFEIKCKIPVAFYVEAETADEAITAIRSTLSGKRIPSRANVIKEAVIRSLDNDMVCEFDAVEQNNRHQTPGFREHEKQPQDAAC